MSDVRVRLPLGAYCGGARAGTSMRLLTARTQVRFLSPQLDVPLAERQRRQPSKLDRRVQLPQGILGDRLMVGCLPLNQATEVRTLLPEPFCRWRVSEC